MDLAVSPDLEAFFCYAIVFALGLIVARRQVAQKMASFKGAWISLQTWLLFLAYSLLPVGLFWLLDRTGAIHDTSLFAALIIGFGYRQILEGSLNSISTSGEISALWKPFVGWTDDVALGITRRIMRRDARFRERVISQLAKDAAQLGHLRVLVESRTPAANLAKLKQNLDEIETTYESLGEDTVNENKAKLLYEKVTALEDFEYLLYRRGITRRWTYFWYAQEWRSKALALGVGLALAIGIATAVQQLTTPKNLVAYYAWRLRKPGTTELDRFRTQRELRAWLATGDQRIAQATCERLAGLLQRPDLAVDRVETLLQLLVENHRIAAGSERMVALLIDSLHSESLDIRVRINTALHYLAARWRLSVSADLAQWNPSLQISPTELEQRIEAWREVFHLTTAIPDARAIPSEPASTPTRPTLKSR